MSSAQGVEKVNLARFSFEVMQHGICGHKDLVEGYTVVWWNW